ncbi:MFS transporter [Marinicellulosiphila megalodicopiae]|uniref:MFS transporter n=1 Tax=Marinicellulosiphila megalodicopiae TaxID=2724896 RepID=UPI003BAFB7D6
MQTTNNPVKKRELFGWAMYDFANSAYTTVIISIVFSAYFVAHVVPQGYNANSYWGLAIGLSSLLALILSPFIGVLCDLSGHKKIYLMVSTFICSLFTGLLFFVGPGDIWLAIGIIIISNAAWMIGESFCASFLSDISSRKNMGLISGLGWAIGYLGGLISLIVVKFVIMDGASDATIDEQVAMNQNAMLFIAAFFLVSAIPTFIWVKSRISPKETLNTKQVFKLGISRLVHSTQIIKKYPVLFKFFIAFTIYIAGYAIIIKFVGIYATQALTLTDGQLAMMFILLQLSAFFGALLFGVIDKFIGPKKSILITLVWWIMGVLSIFNIEKVGLLLGTDANTAFTYLSIAIGLAMGATQSSSRAVVGMLTKKEDSALMFGFWGMFSRLAILLGMTYGFVADAVGLRNALLLIIVFFVVGGILFLFVDMKKGIEQAQD